MFISVTSDATTAIVTTFLLSSFDDVWGFGIFELEFFEKVEDTFALAVGIIEVLGDTEGWSVLDFPVAVSVFAAVVPVVVAGLSVVVENVYIGSRMEKKSLLFLLFTQSLSS